MVGYAINPIITLGAVSIGFISGAVAHFYRKTGGLKIAAALFFAHLIGSVLIKTLGLFLYYGSPFFATLWLRFLIYLGTGLVEFFILYFLSKNRAFVKQMQSIFS